MRITVVSGDRQVFVRTKGGGRKKLARAEGVAKRLLEATPTAEPKTPIGFSAVSDVETIDD